MDLVKLEQILFYVSVAAYLGASVFYIWYLVSRNVRAGNIGAIVLILGLTAHTVALVLRWVTTGHAPMANMYESLSLFAWGLVLFYLIAERFYPIKSAGAIVVPTAFVISSVAAMFYVGSDDPLMPALDSYWLWIHVSIAMLAYGLFALAFGAGFFYIIQEYLLKKQYRHVVIAFTLLLAALGAVAGLKLGTMWAEPAKYLDTRVIAGEFQEVVESDYSGTDILKMLGATGIGLLVGMVLGFLAGKGASRPGFSSRLPSLDVLDEVSYRAIAFGFPLLTIGIITGAIWADQAWGRWWGWDPKETWSLITWLYYGGYLHLRLTMGWRGRHSAILAVIGLIAVLFTYLGVNLLLSGLHSYG